MRVTLTSCHCPYGSLDRILLRQAVQRRVEGEQVYVRLRRDKGIRVRIPALPPAAILVHRLAAGALDLDAPHRLGRGGEEVAAAVPRLGLLHVHQAQVALADQGGRLERLPRLLLRQPLGRRLAQSLVD